MRGDPDSCGVWAPCLSHDGERFHLIYTDVKRYGRTTIGGASGASLRDFHNYLVTCRDDRRRLVGSRSISTRSGFDPSLFHDEDGRKWLLNMLWDHRPGRNRFAGIVAAGISIRRRRRWSASAAKIFEGTALGLTEAPHLYKRDGYYYLHHRRGRHRLGPCGDDGALARACSAPTSCTPTPRSSPAATGPTRRCSAPAMPIWSRLRTGET